MKNVKIYAVKARITPFSKNKKQKFKPAFRLFQGIVVDEFNHSKEELNAYIIEHVSASLNLKDEISYKVVITEIILANKHFSIQTKDKIS